MLSRIGVWITRFAQRVVPHTMVLAIFLSAITAMLCFLLTPLQATELLQIWAGSGQHPLMRTSVDGLKPWVVTKVEPAGKNQLKLSVWRKTSPGQVAKALRSEKSPYPVDASVRGKYLIVKGISAKQLKENLVLLHVPARTRGIWHFLSFAMQMCLILLTGYVLAVSRPVMNLIRRAASFPKDAGAAAGLVALVAMVSGWINWGFGLIVGAYFAREVGKQGARRGIPMHYPLLGAAGYTALLIWHGGLSGSAPLKVAERGHLSGQLGLSLSQIPLTETIFSPLNLAVTISLLFSVPLLCRGMTPTRTEDMQPFGAFADAQAHEYQESAQGGTWLDNWPGINILLAAPMLGYLAYNLSVYGLQQFSINHVIILFLAVGLLLHRGIYSFLSAGIEGSRSCAGIMLQFPLYAGIFSILYESGLVEIFAAWAGKITYPTLFLVVNFLTSGLLNIFIPSGGGQWGIQGAIVLTAAQQLNISPGTSVMTIAYGDQWTNMIQPFWALALLEITGLKARDIIGYTILLMVATGFLFLLALVLFG